MAFLTMLFAGFLTPCFIAYWKWVFIKIAKLFRPSFAPALWICKTLPFKGCPLTCPLARARRTGTLSVILNRKPAMRYPHALSRPAASLCGAPARLYIKFHAAKLTAKIIARSAFAAAGLCLWAQMAAASCQGVNLFNALPQDQQDQIRMASTKAPYSSGNLWRASRGTEVITIIGTYHLNDPRHAPMIALAKPLIETAGALLVEAGPDEQAALKEAMLKTPSRMFISEGPSLIQLLPPELWQRLSDAMKARGVPGIMAAKFRPWYAMMVLSLPPCAMAQMVEPKGLDGELIDLADAAGVKIQALEPWTTVFGLLEGLTPSQEIDMLETSLAMESQSEDFSSTLADLYFAGESRLLWELMRHLSAQLPGVSADEVDAEMALMEDVMMTKRNQAWVPVIEAATQSHSAPLVLAFGALHLAGETGVLNLLAQNGWQVERLNAD